MSNTVILLKKSVVSGNTPGSLRDGEIAINTADGILFYKNPSNVIKYIRNTNSFETVNVNGSLLLSTSPNDILSFYSNNGIQVTGNPSTDTITISGVSASTSVPGVVQLFDGTNSSSNALAATANVVNSVYQLANSAYNIAIAGGTTPITAYNDLQQFTANTGQTGFVISGGYTAGSIAVYVNGVLLDSSDYTAADGTNVHISIPLSGGDQVSVFKWYFDSSVYLTAQQRYDQLIANSGQVVFASSTNYTPGNIRVFRNGILLEESEVTATNGANVSLTHAATANDIVTLHYWSGSGIGTTPVYQAANQAVIIAQQALDAANNVLQDLTYANLFSNSVNTSINTANQVLDIFSSSTYRSVKYQIQVTSGSDYQTSEVSLIHNGSNSFLTEYGVITTNSSLINYDTDMSGGSVRLLMSPTNNINTIKFVKTSIVL